MSLISCRKCHLIGVKNEDIDRIVEEIKALLKTVRIPSEYSINIYKDWVACCGFFPIGVAVEIEGKEKHDIKNIDLKIYSKIIEICEREGIDHHECEPLEFIKA